MIFPGREDKKNRTIIKCEDCGFKYYKGDVHKCLGHEAAADLRVREKTEEKIEEEKEIEQEKKTTKNRRKFF